MQRVLVVPWSIAATKSAMAWNTIPRLHRLEDGLVAALETGQQHLRLKALAVSVSQAVDPPGHPREWEADVLLADGGVAHLRPIRPSDADRLVAFYERVSPSWKYPLLRGVSAAE